MNADCGHGTLSTGLVAKTLTRATDCLPGLWFSDIPRVELNAIRVIGGSLYLNGFPEGCVDQLSELSIPLKAISVLVSLGNSFCGADFL